jgi:hypothetical protein
MDQEDGFVDILSLVGLGAPSRRRRPRRTTGGRKISWAVPARVHDPEGGRQDADEGALSGLRAVVRGKRDHGAAKHDVWEEDQAVLFDTESRSAWAVL